MAGQAHHFLNYAPSMDPPNELPYAQQRYRNEVGRLYSVLNRRLADREFVAGAYSIADMAIWPWAKRLAEPAAGHRALPAHEGLARAGRRTAGGAGGHAVGKDKRSDLTKDREAQKILFGQTARD